MPSCPVVVGAITSCDCCPWCRRARSRPIETWGRRCGPGRDGSESGRSVERSRLAWLSNRLPPCWGLASERRASCRGLAVAWLKRGVSATKILELGVPATVLTRRKGRSVSMAAVMIGVDPHKASHPAVVISAAEEPLGELRVRACAAQAEQLLAWAAAWPQRTWAVEGAGGLGHLLAQQLLSAGEPVLD